MKKLKSFLTRRLPLRRRSIRIASSAIPSAIDGTPNYPIASNAMTHTSKLERLPFDVQHQILLALDGLNDLSALVHASPVYHGHYLLRRRFWLWRSLWLILDRALVDAYTVHLSNSSRFRRKRTKEGSGEFIAAYEMRRSMEPQDLLALPIEDVIAMSAFYSSTIRPMLRHYVAWTRGNLHDLSVPDALSKREEIRITRGLYRFQLFSNLFGRLQRPRKAGPGLGEKQRLRLLELFEPWEIEEVICINTFVESKYDMVFDQVQDDLDPENVRFGPERLAGTPPGAYWLSNSIHREYYLNGMISLGLIHLHTTLKVTNHSKLVDMMADNMTHGDEWMNDAVHHRTQQDRRRIMYSDRDKAQDRRDEMLFVGDKDEAPPLAWVTIWRGTYSNLFGDQIPAPLRKWGYVMWDADRLQSSGALGVLDREWREMFEYPPGQMEDPRDDM